MINYVNSGSLLLLFCSLVQIQNDLRPVWKGEEDA